MSLHEKDYDHYKALFQLIVQSCKQERLAIMPVKDKRSGSTQLALVSVNLSRENDESFEAGGVSLAILASPSIMKFIEPMVNFPEDWDVIMDDSSLELDDRKRWRPPTRGTL